MHGKDAIPQPPVAQGDACCEKELLKLAVQVVPS